ncbi:hypothetical protein J2Y54_000583 [Sphingomonas sp. BE123]|uniref:hypothetical protein n=1 Tax=Sphingomonas sp. BE123 TaxID=2817842 RepID=UPI002854B8F1|nr:hypothetical protein [Sphingomonas sp. BE123]MDR6851090.1 hypothetical protein [Sphingomonas sp. BE123]
MVDIPTLAQEIAAIVSEEVERANAPQVRDVAELKARAATALDLDAVERLVAERIERAMADLPPPAPPAEIDMAAVEQMVAGQVERAVAALPPPAPPAEVDMAAIERLVADRVERAVAALPPPAPPAEVDMVAIERLVADRVERAIAALPPPAPPAEVDMAAVERLVAERVERAVAAVPPPAPPAEVDMAAVERLVAERVERAVAALPPPAPPAEVDMAAVEQMVAARVERAVAALPPAPPGQPGQSGVGLAGALINRDGNLIITLSNGELQDLGRVVGREGFSLENFDTKWDGERTLTLSFNDGRQEYSHQLHMPIVIYRDVYAEGVAYEPGDAVTWGGSLWIAQRTTSAKPDTTDSGWKLSVKRGRDGKDKTS